MGNDYSKDRPMHDLEGEEDFAIHGAAYKGLFHGWECPECNTINFEEEDIDPREIGIHLSCSECGWSGRIDE